MKGEEMQGKESRLERPDDGMGSRREAKRRRCSDSEGGRGVSSGLATELADNIAQSQLDAGEPMHDLCDPLDQPFEGMLGGEFEGEVQDDLATPGT